LVGKQKHCLTRLHKYNVFLVWLSKCYQSYYLTCAFIVWGPSFFSRLKCNHIDMQYIILFLISVHVVDTEMFVRSNHVLDQIINNKHSRSLLDCASMCDMTNGCKAFSFTTSEQRCFLAKGIMDNVTFDGIVYVHESAVSIFNAVTINSCG